MDEIKAILIDDEPMPREVLKLKIQECFPEIAIVSEASNITQGYDAINKYNPALIFLDVNMPNGSGFQLLQKFENINFEIIFTTAYEEFALDAFKTNAIGYLVKPIRTLEFIKVVNNAVDKINLKEIRNKYSELLSKNIKETKPDKINIHTSDELIVLNISEIIRCEGWEKYTYFYTSSKKILSTHNIGWYKEILEANNFFLCHKSHIINKEMVAGYNKDGFIILKDSTKIPLARRRKHIFNEWINL